MSIPTTLKPGDFCCVDILGDVGAFIHLAEKLSGGPYSQYQHVFVYVGDGKIVQAQPGGAAELPLYERPLMLWSTDIVKPTDAQRGQIVASARMYAFRGVPYSFLDYVAIFAHQEHLNFPGLKDYISHTGHMICSQLVDQCYANAQYHLFLDGRWPGFVRPSDMAEAIERSV